ncbi:FAD-dependent oxidoreductase [Bifidobacterium catenulatum subsp. kashiwanohense]|uniref:FAD-dependent oxidoreductase n=1 Tax=Bifidobacterium catenulatum TaxID=1686 RepID=UPI00248196A1|nr:FAD-dependent oxidoreductase [Bifidobacterium catenulatum]MDH7872138.1 FAD-dependent oxidoreductase [Bifidobacterium catenulatum subsp. kashiwanohense]MDH7874214.1 FAD-dependent oxidoreductase [Bifidobacterium catenulatum subsp. kashiwanohense]MDH7883489.1 FAD-dependent oxidoreductase [Bifidobacterium catenulatum subsp. kashiwanohense]MDH7888937.1 FAD-dependent oxidoreductase [Bifidobacterium catenulatum subsp. kashiwanohense]MDH7902596.1 FAD-dependent oxidoreductase [Bifidobacterium catenu
MSRNDLYDVIVIGGGPAGLTAGLYLARARYRVLILEKDDFGGQITITNEVVNYPGVGRTTGRALTQTMRQQAQDFGAEFLSAEAIGLDVHGDVKTVHTSRGDLKAFGILIATGASPRKLGFEGESEYAGRGVAYCATCDGEFFAGKEVLVVGGGFAAAEESVFLTTYASKVTVLVREQDFTCDAAVAAAAKNNPKIDVRYQVELQGVTAGQGGLREASILNRATGQTETWKPADGGTFGVFVFAGYVPATNLVRGVVELDDYGYVVTHGYLETSVPGVYAAGDLRTKNLRQVVTATADGAIAAVELERYAKRMSEKTGLMPQRPASYVYEQSTAKTNAASLDATAPAPAPAKRSADAAAAANVVRKPGELFSDATRQQLNVVFGRMSRPVTLALDLDDTPLSTELRGFIDALVALSGGKLKSTVVDGEYKKDDTGRAVFDVDSVLPAARPCVRMVVDGKPTGLAFHGVPSGHEFNSFVLGLYNVAGPGQPLDDDLIERARSITDPLDIMILVSLTCTMCPESVLASQRIASLNPAVRVEAYDVAHFPELKDHYGAMSVPCIVITWADGTQQVEFGKKSIPQMLELVGA